MPTFALLSAIALSCAQESDPNAGLLKGDAARDGGDSGVTLPDDGCGKLAKATCNLLVKCGDGGFFQANFGDLDRCTSRIDAGCRASLQAPGTGESQAHLDDCYFKIDKGCVEFFARNTKLWLKTPWAGLCDLNPPHGKGVEGSACAENAQCDSGLFCRPGPSGCGVCKASLGQGATCGDDLDCGPRLVCASDKTCEPAEIINGSCGVDRPCAADLFCLAAVKECRETAQKAGDKCDPKTNACDATRGLVCGPGNTCVTTSVKPPVADGAACVDGVACTSPARCVGTCRILDVTTCK